MAEYTALSPLFSDIANAIREKDGSTGTIPAETFPERIKGIQTGTTAPSVEQATPSITVSPGGLITASATQSAGLVSAGTKTATQQLTTQSAKTWTPTTSNQTISSGVFLTGMQTIKGDSNLIASNIKSGVSIFGITGNAVSGGSLRTYAEGVSITSTKAVFTVPTVFLKYYHVVLYTLDDLAENNKYSFVECASYKLPSGYMYNIVDSQVLSNGKVISLGYGSYTPEVSTTENSLTITAKGDYTFSTSTDYIVLAFSWDDSIEIVM